MRSAPMAAPATRPASVIFLIMLPPRNNYEALTEKTQALLAPVSRWTVAISSCLKNFVNAETREEICPYCREHSFNTDREQQHWTTFYVTHPKRKLTSIPNSCDQADTTPVTHTGMRISPRAIRDTHGQFTTLPPCASHPNLHKTQNLRYPTVS